MSSYNEFVYFINMDKTPYHETPGPITLDSASVTIQKAVTT